MVLSVLSNMLYANYQKMERNGRAFKTTLLFIMGIGVIIIIKEIEQIVNGNYKVTEKLQKFTNKKKKRDEDKPLNENSYISFETKELIYKLILNEIRKK